MTEFSDRVEHVSISGIREVFEAAGEDAINMGLGQPDFPTPAHAKEAAKAGIDPVQFRKRNDANPIRQQMYDTGAKLIGWDRRQPDGAQTGPVKRGFGVGATSWGNGSGDATITVSGSESDRDVKVISDAAAPTLTNFTPSGAVSGPTVDFSVDVADDDLGSTSDSVEVTIDDGRSTLNTLTLTQPSTATASTTPSNTAPTDPPSPSLRITTTAVRGSRCATTAPASPSTNWNRSARGRRRTSNTAAGSGCG